MAGASVERAKMLLRKRGINWVEVVVKLGLQIMFPIYNEAIGKHIRCEVRKSLLPQVQTE